MTTQSHDQNGFFNRTFTINWEMAIYIVILLLALFTRFYILGDRVMSHDESLHTRYSWNLADDQNFQHSPLMHGPILFHATAFFYTLFGDNDFTSRIYTSLLSVLLVMAPLLFRRWLGRWGTILASMMFLISPLIMYYGRYIRHDTPSILAALVMIWAVMMYISGPNNQKRRAHWLYIIAVSMIWNLGSKETSFIYIAIIGIFLALYFFVRLLQHFRNIPGKTVFYIGMIGTLLGGVMSLGMYTILDIVKFDLLSPAEGMSFADLSAYDQQYFFLWTFIAIASVVVVTLGTLFWVYNDARINWLGLLRGKISVSYKKTSSKIPWGEVASVLAIAAFVCLALVVFEEVSHTQPLATEPVTTVPGQEATTDVITESLRWFPMILVWGGAVVGFIFLFLTRRKNDNGDGKDKLGRGFWGTMDLFPEFDLIIVIGTLILPWATAIIPYMMKSTPATNEIFANGLPQAIFNFVQSPYVPGIVTPDQVGGFVLHFLAWVPLMVLAIAIGLMWNWKRWLIAAGIFHLLFAFFFTTIFTNISGLATGMIYSLGYWLEQQSVRRGSQPQYYYLLVIMPFYEFLPVIGGISSMFAGLAVFWGWRKKTHDTLEDNRKNAEQAWLEAQIDEQDDNYAADESEQIVAAPNEEARQEHDAAVERLVEQRQASRLVDFPFLIFFAWLAVLNLVGYSLAGEKMPWLGTHLTTPLIILSAWYFGRIFDKIEFAKFRDYGWASSAVLAVGFIGLFRVVGTLLMGPYPFQGTSTPQLEASYEWLAALIVTGVAFAGVFYLQERVGWKHMRQMMVVSIFAILSVITFRSAWISSFINYDYPTEFLVYAHAAPGVKWVLEDIEEYSLRMTDGYELRFAYDNEVSWPYSWYFRNYDNDLYVGENPTMQQLDDAVVVVAGAANLGKFEPLLEDRYIRFEHNRLWWPMQDYFNLTAARVNTAFALDSYDNQGARIRQGIFDIWWSRDYTSYGLAVDKSYDIESWPVADRMYIFVRKDFAAQIWNYGIGEGGVANPLDEIEQNLCTANWQELNAIEVLQSPEGMTNPVGIEIAPDGTIYVAEEFGHRITIFNTQGQYLGNIGTEGAIATDGTPVFERPNSLTVDADGNIYVADTWNHRIQVFSPEFDLLTTWGQVGSYGIGAPESPVDGFWGPREVALDDTGRVFVADTGNKRVRVYQMDDMGNATYLYDIGTGGSGLGQLDEPTGLVVHPDGRLYVADTWNRRISVFTTDGVFLNTYRVRGWYQQLVNRPYLALDVERDYLYVTDPDVGRVLVYNSNGDCLGSFGQAAGTTPTLGQFGVASGIAVDADGYVYVVDNQLGRVLKFAPFPYTPPPVEENVSGDDTGSLAGEVVIDENPIVDDNSSDNTTEEDAPPSE